MMLFINKIFTKHGAQYKKWRRSLGTREEQRNKFVDTCEAIIL